MRSPGERSGEKGPPRSGHEDGERGRQSRAPARTGTKPRRNRAPVAGVAPFALWAKSARRAATFGRASRPRQAMQARSPRAQHRHGAPGSPCRCEHKPKAPGNAGRVAFRAGARAHQTVDARPAPARRRRSPPRAGARSQRPLAVHRPRRAARPQTRGRQRSHPHPPGGSRPGAHRQLTIPEPMTPRPQRPPRFSRLELQIMEALWSLGPVSIREIQETFAPASRPAYTTIQTTVYRLEAKNAVRRTRKIGNAHIFEAAVARQAAHRRLMDEWLGLFGGRT